MVSLPTIGTCPSIVIDPPKGDGWQLWETTSEGSPVSPVFKTAEELAEWCAENATAFADFRASREDWLKMFLDDTTDTGTLFVIDGTGRAGALYEFEEKE